MTDSDDISSHIDAGVASNKDVPQFVTPMSLLQPGGSRRPQVTPSNAPNPLDREQLEALVRTMQAAARMRHVKRKG